jgi:hypothetical protein
MIILDVVRNVWSLFPIRSFVGARTENINVLLFFFLERAGVELPLLSFTL